MMEICNTSNGLRRKRSAGKNLELHTHVYRESSVQIFLSNKKLFIAAAEDVIGKNLDDFLAQATHDLVEKAIRDTYPAWSALLTALRDSKVSEQQAWSLLGELRQGGRVKRDTDKDDDELSVCLLTAQTGYGLVRSAGFPHYEDPSLGYCREDFVANCLPQI